MKRITALTLLALVLLLSVPVAQAQEGPSTPSETGYELDWWTVDGGGSTSPAGTGYSLSGTVGQPDAARWGASQTRSYALSGGFWVAGPAVAGYEIFLPVVVRGGS